MTVMRLLDERRAEIHAIAAKHGVTTLRVFGSVARCDARADSDVDFLIELGPTTSAWFPAGLILDLEQLLGHRVEVVTEQALNPTFRAAVLREAKPVSTRTRCTFLPARCLSSHSCCFPAVKWCAKSWNRGKLIGS